MFYAIAQMYVNGTPTKVKLLASEVFVLEKEEYSPFAPESASDFNEQKQYGRIIGDRMEFIKILFLSDSEKKRDAAFENPRKHHIYLTRRRSIGQTSEPLHNLRLRQEKREANADKNVAKALKADTKINQGEAIASQFIQKRKKEKQAGKENRMNESPNNAEVPNDNMDMEGQQVDKKKKKRRKTTHEQESEEKSAGSSQTDNMDGGPVEDVEEEERLRMQKDEEKRREREKKRDEEKRREREKKRDEEKRREKEKKKEEERLKKQEDEDKKREEEERLKEQEDEDKKREEEERLNQQKHEGKHRKKDKKKDRKQKEEEKREEEEKKKEERLKQQKHEGKHRKKDKKKDRKQKEEEKREEEDKKKEERLKKQQDEGKKERDKKDDERKQSDNEESRKLAALTIQMEKLKAEMATLKSKSGGASTVQVVEEKSTLKKEEHKSSDSSSDSSSDEMDSEKGSSGSESETESKEECNKFHPFSLSSNGKAIKLPNGKKIDINKFETIQWNGKLSTRLLEIVKLMWPESYTKLIKDGKKVKDLEEPHLIRDSEVTIITDLLNCMQWEKTCVEDAYQKHFKKKVPNYSKKRPICQQLVNLALRKTTEYLRRPPKKL